MEKRKGKRKSLNSVSKEKLELIREFSEHLRGENIDLWELLSREKIDELWRSKYNPSRRK